MAHVSRLSDEEIERRKAKKASKDSSSSNSNSDNSTDKSSSEKSKSFDSSVNTSRSDHGSDLDQKKNTGTIEKEPQKEKEKKEAGDKAAEKTESVEDAKQARAEAAEKVESGKSSKKKENLGKKAGAHAAGAVVGKTMQAAALMQIKAWLMAMMQAAMQAVTAVASTIASTVVTIVQTVVAAGAIAMTVAIGGIVGVVALGVIALFALFGGIQDSQRDYVYENCEEQVAESVEGFTGDITAQEYQNAQMIWAVLSEVGVPDVNIAGLLGNFSHESGIDPTSIEGIYGTSEKYSVYSTRKYNALIDLNQYTLNYLNRNTSLNRDNYYNPADYLYYCGIGLGQWTATRAYQLTQIAATMNSAWYDLDTQLIYMLTEDSKANWLRSWEEELSPRIAALNFMRGWEGHSGGDGSLSNRQSEARTWYNEILMWSYENDGTYLINYDPDGEDILIADVDSSEDLTGEDIELREITEVSNRFASYSSSVMNAMQNTSLAATSEAAHEALNICENLRTYDNSSIAQAAVSFAWQTKDMAVNNQGTLLFQTVHDNVLVSDTIYMACDRCVASAVRWSGADDHYPAGDVKNQLEHLVTNTQQWIEVDWQQDISNLQPGDIFIVVDEPGVHNHTAVYVTYDLVKQKYPGITDESMCVVSGSLDEYSPAVVSIDSYLQPYYKVFRNIKRTSNPRYTNAGATITEGVDTW